MNSLISMEQSSTPNSLNMKKQSIIAGHLKKLPEITWNKFKKALCRKKPSQKAEGIKMRNIKDKSMEYIVELIFKCYTERRGPGTILKILTELKENQMRISIQREIRQASEGLKVCSMGSSEGLKVCSMGSSEGLKVCSMGSEDGTRNDDTVSSSEPPAKKIRLQDQDVPGPSHDIQTNVNQKGGPRPTLRKLKQGISRKTQQSMIKRHRLAKKQLKQGLSQNSKQIAHKKGEPRPDQGQPKQELAALSELLRNPDGFFREVEARPALYTPNHPHNCDKEVKKNLWKEVASKLIKDWEQLDSKDKEEIIISLPKKWKNFVDSFKREYKKQVKNDPGQYKRTKYRYFKHLTFLLPTMNQRQTTSNPDCKQDDAQRDSENLDDIRPKTKQAAANKTESAFPPDNMSPEMDEDSFFLLSFMNWIREIPPENKPPLKIEMIQIFEKYAKPVVPHNVNTVTVPSHNSCSMPVPMASNPACYPLPVSSPRIPSSSQSSPCMSSHDSV